MGSITGPTLAGMIGDALGVQSIFLAFIVPFGMLAIYTSWKTRNTRNRIEWEIIAATIRSPE